MHAQVSSSAKIFLERIEQQVVATISIHHTEKNNKAPFCNEIFEVYDLNILFNSY